MHFLNRYILRETAWPALLALAVVAFVGVTADIREKKDIAYAYATVADLARLMVYFLPSLLSYVIPVAYMMGILLAFGRLAQQNEIIAMKAAGIPLKRVLLPVIAGGALLAAGTFVLQDRVQPAALQRANNLIYFDMALRATLDVLPTGMMHRFGDWRVYIGDKDPEQRLLQNIDILVPRDDRSIVYVAREAQVLGEGRQQQLMLRDGYMIYPQAGGGLLAGTLDDTALPLPLIAEQIPPGRLQLLTFGELLRFQAGRRDWYDPRVGNRHGLLQTPNQIQESRLEIGKRLAMPLACLAVSLVAAPLAVRTPRGGRSYGFAIGFGIALFFYLSYFALQPHSMKPLSEVILRSVAPNVILAAAGLWLIWRVDRV